MYAQDVMEVLSGEIKSLKESYSKKNCCRKLLNKFIVTYNELVDEMNNYDPGSGGKKLKKVKKPKVESSMVWSEPQEGLTHGENNSSEETDK